MRKKFLVGLFILGLTSPGYSSAEDGSDYQKKAQAIADYLGTKIRSTFSSIKDGENESNKKNEINKQKMDVSTRDVLSKFINEKCDKPLFKENYSICFSYNYRAATFVGYSLKKSDMLAKSISKRPDFYPDEDVKESYRVDPSDYKHSGYDRGHLAPDASFDHNQHVLNSVYAMTNIVPQVPEVNRYGWAEAEKRERSLAIKNGQVTVLNGVVYEDNPERIGAHHVAIPSRFWKAIISDKVSECYLFENEKGSTKSFEESRINCSKVGL